MLIFTSLIPYLYFNAKAFTIKHIQTTRYIIYSTYGYSQAEEISQD